MRAPLQHMPASRLYLHIHMAVSILFR
jgi:hypothetical protein